MLTKNEILSKITYKVDKKAFFFIGDEINQNEFDLEKDEKIIVFYTKNKILFLLSNTKLHFKDEKGENKSISHSKISGKELKIRVEEKSYILKIFVKISNQKRLHISLNFEKYDDANVAYEIFDFIPQWFRNKKSKENLERIDKVTISILEENWNRELTVEEKENPTKTFTNYVKTLNKVAQANIVKKLLKKM
ncbi:hypothetical protein [Aureispira sp. CCB-E]|uniref:hypothetical protein n=1 Tax=Aureispira sp. CCB-E TaxID=3051121 RepID=UPI0028693A67|nr:hypothetical protein [Aureispira sp. CCB-E]WMX13174.1 hypothetical protein QP953_20230 [Aureispira sp. CCB-E]